MRVVATSSKLVPPDSIPVNREAASPPLYSDIPPHSPCYANPRHPSPPPHGAQPPFSRRSSPDVASSPHDWLPGLTAPLSRPLPDTPRQTDTHTRIAVVVLLEDVSLVLPTGEWWYFVAQIELHPETRYRSYRCRCGQGCEGSFPVGSFLKAAWACGACLGCLERLVIQEKPISWSSR